MRLLVTGATGLLGLNLSLLAAAQGHRVTGLAHSRNLRGIPFDLKRLDLRQVEEALSIIQAAQPEAIIHCAAIANIDAAENAYQETFQLNVEIPGILAEAAENWGIPFVHISSDAVFDGEKGDYVETDPQNPLSLYAQTKLAGEQAVQRAYPSALIVRVVFFGWSLSGKRSLSEFFFNHLQSGHSVNGFVDTFFCPLYAEDLAATLLEMLAAGLTGIYHVTSPETLSKYDFGLRIARRFGFDPDLIKPTRASEIDREAPRSLNLTLRSDKVQAALGHPLPSVDEGIEKYYQRWLEGYPAYLQSLEVKII